MGVTDRVWQPLASVTRSVTIGRVALSSGSSLHPQIATPSRRVAVLLLLATALLWSSGGVLIKVTDWQPLSILGGRSLLAAIVFVVYLKGWRFRINRWHLLGAGALLATQVLYITAMKMTTAANAIFLQYSAPIYVMLLGIWWLGEQPDRADWLSMGIIFAGMAFFFGDRLTIDGLIGSLLALVSGITMAVSMVSLRALKDGAPAATLLLTYTAGALIGAPAMLGEAWTLPNVAMIGFLGIVQIGLAFICYAMAIRVVRALEATLIVTLEPILNPLWVFLAIGERPGPLALVGGALVIGGVALRAFVSTHEKRRGLAMSAESVTLPIVRPGDRA